ncbi:MAG: hypothetical protein J1F63_05545 [Oscillospiraceae bacterium]|nr:hypothetical protein [Oscillospiraceae bacterium]
MNKKDLFMAIGNISDELIEEAETTQARRFNIKKICLISVAAVLVLCATAFAATMAVTFRSSGHTSSIPDYYSVPSTETLAKDIGITPSLVEEFSNGYAFKSGHIGQNQNYDESDNVIEEYSSISCWYELGDEKISLHIDGSVTSYPLDEDEAAYVYKETPIGYYSYMNKLVPGNYELTEQDKADRDAGKYVFSFGSSEIEVIEIQGLSWKYSGLNYNLITMDNSITKDELIKMAKELIDAQE